MNSKTNKTPFLLFVVSALFGLIFLLYLGPTQAGDSPSYLRIAAKLLNPGSYLQADDAIRPPGYPLFIAAIEVIAGENLYAIALAQLFIFSATSVLVYWTAKLIYDEKVARLAGWLFALNPALAYFGILIISEIPSIFFAVMACYFTIAGILKNSYPRIALAGLALSCMLWIRPIGLVLGLIFTLTTLLIPNVSGRLKKSIFLFLPLAVVYLGWSAHNYLAFGWMDYNPIYGLNLLERTIYLDRTGIDSPIINDVQEKFMKAKVEQPLGIQTDEMYYWWATIQTTREYRKMYNLFELNRNNFKLAIQLIKNDPDGYSKATVREWVHIWAGYSPRPGKLRPVSSMDFPASEKEASWIFLVMGLMLGLVMFSLVVVASVDNLINRHWLSLYFIIPAILIPLITAFVSVTDYRYRLIVEPFILILISYGIVNIRRFFDRPIIVNGQSEINKSAKIRS